MTTTGLTTELILASASPRRAAFLDLLGVSYRVVPAGIDEVRKRDESPNNYVRRIALEKAEVVCARTQRSGPVLAADTAVAIEGALLGKPENFSAAAAMLSQLSGRWHEVYSGVALVQRTAEVIGVRTRVKFRKLTPVEIKAYWASGEPADKAGAYGIQGLGGAFVERIEGSYSNVVGLPLVETLELFARAGLRSVFSGPAD